MNFDTTLTRSRKMWAMVKEKTKSNKTSTQQSIISNQKTINKPKSIAQLANNFFIEKIIKIKNSFKKVDVTQ